MLIEFDFDFDAGGNIIAKHIWDSSPANVITHPDGVTGKVHALIVMKLVKDGSPLVKQHGWDVVSKHPTYPGKTRLQVLLAEIVRLNDTPARALLGV